MLYILAGLGAVLICLLTIRILVGVGRRRKIKTAAYADYLGFKSDLKAWYADRDNHALRYKADVAMKVLGECSENRYQPSGGHASTVSTADLLSYAKEIKTHYDREVFCEPHLVPEIGDEVFIDAVCAHFAARKKDMVMAPLATVPARSDRLERQTRPTECPQCGDSPVIEIMYGLPDFENKKLMQELIDRHMVLGGCLYSEDDPDWICKSCGLEMFRKSVGGQES